MFGLYIDHYNTIVMELLLYTLMMNLLKAQIIITIFFRKFENYEGIRSITRNNSDLSTIMTAINKI